MTRYLWAGNLSLVFSNGISVSRKVPGYDKKSKVFPSSIVCSTLSHESSLNKNKRLGVKFTTFFWNLVFCLCFHLVVWYNEFHVGLSSPCQWSVFSSKVFTEFSIEWWFFHVSCKQGFDNFLLFLLSNASILSAIFLFGKLSVCFWERKWNQWRYWCLNMF